MKLSVEHINQLAETVYGQLHQENEETFRNWGTLSEELRADFVAVCYAWLAMFRQGQKLEAAFDGVPGLIWKMAGVLTGRPMDDRNNYLQLELPVLEKEMRARVSAVMQRIKGSDADRTKVPGPDSTGEGKA